MSRFSFKEALQKGVNAAGFGLLTFAFLTLATPLLPIGLINAGIGLANIAIATTFATVSNPAALSVAGLFGATGATYGFFHKDK